MFAFDSNQALEFMRNKILLAIFGLAMVLSGCGDYIEAPYTTIVDPRGKVISSNLIETWTLPQVDSIINTLSGGASGLLQPEYGVSIYKVNYQTVDPFGGLISASGAFAVPNAENLGPLPFASYQHGTESKDSNVPSQRNGEVVIGIVMASTGYMCAMPDYLGLGEGPGIHPYVHAKSEATAVIDMLRACRELAPKLGHSWDSRIFLFGYSQGGHATMAAHKEIQENYRSEFTVTASAPMAGPYDVSGVQEQVIVSHSPYPTPGYLPYVFLSYAYAYRDLKLPSLSDVLKPPYDSIIPPMFNGQFSIGEINNVSSTVPRDMVLDSIMNAYESDDNHPLKIALRDNNLWDWKPLTPVKMFYCSSDDQVSYQNAIVAYDHFIQNGSTVVSLFETANNLNHSDCALPTMLYGKMYLDSIKALPF